MKHIITIDRNAKPRSLNLLTDKFNTVYRYLDENYGEKADGLYDMDRVLLRDAVLEGFLLGLQWAAGGPDDTKGLMDHKAEIAEYLYNSSGVHANS